MQRNPFKFSAFDSGFACGALLFPAVLEKAGICGRGALHDAREKWDPHRRAYFTGQLRQPCFSDRKPAPSGWNRFLPDWFGAAFTCLLGFAERRTARAFGGCAAPLADYSWTTYCPYTFFHFFTF